MTQEWVTSTTQRLALKSGLRSISSFSSPRGRIWGIYNLAVTSSSCPVYPASRHRFCGFSSVGLGRYMTMLSYSSSAYAQIASKKPPAPKAGNICGCCYPFQIRRALLSTGSLFEGHKRYLRVFFCNLAVSCLRLLSVCDLCLDPVDIWVSASILCSRIRLTMSMIDSFFLSPYSSPMDYYIIIGNCWIGSKYFSPNSFLFTLYSLYFTENTSGVFF